jgi:hypothetical protein
VIDISSAWVYNDGIHQMKITDLVAITPRESLGSDIQIRVLRALFQRG